MGNIRVIIGGDFNIDIVGMIRKMNENEGMYNKILEFNKS